MPEPKRSLKVFLCHAHEDKLKTRELYRYLHKRGIQPWLDAEDLVGGQDWKEEITKAINASDAIIICLSKNSISKEGFIQAEITFALDKALEIPRERIFIIPARFEDCEVPNEKLKRYQWVDLFDDDGFRKLMKALKKRATQLELATVKIPKIDESQPNLASTLKQDIKESDAKDKHGVTEKAAHKKVERDAIGKSKREKAEIQDAQKDVLTKNLSKTLALSKAVPFLRIAGVIGIIIALFWVVPKFFSPVPAALPTISPTVVLTIIPPKLISSLTPSKTITPSFTPTTTSTIMPTLTPTLVPTPITSTVLIMDGPRQNCRVSPNGEIVDYIAPGTNVLAFGRNENSDWLFIKIKSNEKYCWIKTDGVQYQVDEIAGLPLGVVYSKGVEMVLIPSGKFTMGDHVDTLVNACKRFDKVSENCDRSIFYDIFVKDVDLAPFYIDKYEVSNLQYKSCVDAGDCKPPDSSKSQTREKYYGNTQYDKYPVVYVTWEMANTYCQWRGDRLPSEAEWEKAARGTDGRLFPWGSDFTGIEANFRDKNYNKTISFDDGNKDTAPVNAYIQGISPYGIYNMAGNVWEWVFDKYTENPNDFRMVFRGGAWSHPVYALFSSNRGTNSMLYSEYNIGFRCARDATP